MKHMPTLFPLIALLLFSTVWCWKCFQNHGLYFYMATTYFTVCRGEFRLFSEKPVLYPRTKRPFRQRTCLGNRRMEGLRYMSLAGNLRYQNQTGRRVCRCRVVS